MVASSMRRSFRLLLDVPAELVAHGREQLVREIGFAARAEALVQRGSQHRRRHRFVDALP